MSPCHRIEGTWARRDNNEEVLFGGQRKSHSEYQKKVESKGVEETLKRSQVGGGSKK